MTDSGDRHSSVSIGGWTPDAQLAFSKHRDTADEVLEVDVVEEAFQRELGSRQRVILEPEHEDPSVRAGRMGPEITEAAVQGDDESVLGGRCLAHGGIIGTDEALIGNGVDVMVPRCEHLSQRRVEVLVELDLHPATAGYSSRASSAPYAIAARMPSRVTDG